MNKILCFFDSTPKSAEVRRNFNTYGLLAQAWFRDLRVGYVFEVPTNQSVGQRFTSHDIALTYTLPFMAHHDRGRFSNF